MSKLFRSDKRFIGLGVMSALVIALAVLGALWGFSQGASANNGTVTLVHVNPDGSDYTGNPACPDTTWSGGKPTVNPNHDCNNITSQDHVIRTSGWDPAYFQVEDWNVTNATGATADVVVADRCGDIAQVVARVNWDPANDDEACIVIHSSTPGETRVTLTYDDDMGAGTVYTTGAVVKEWDSLIDSVILKYGDLQKVKVTIAGGGTKDMYLVKDVDGDGDRDADDEHLLDKQSVWQDHAVILDEATKRIRADAPVEIIEVIHGGHDVLINDEIIHVHQATEGAIILVQIESDRGCSFFTNGAAVDCDDDGVNEAAGECNFGRQMNGVSNGLGRFVGPQVVPAVTMPLGLSLNPFSHSGPYPNGAPPISEDCTDPPCDVGEGFPLENIFVDTVCEEQAKIVITVGYPDMPGSLREPLEEWVGINWVTTELAKQPVIRWAGEEIVLAKRWAPPGAYYPNLDANDEPLSACPLATVSGAVYDWTANDPATEPEDTVTTHHVNYVLKDPGLGALEGAYRDIDGDGVLDTLSFMGQSEAVGDIDDMCISKALADSEEPGEQDIEAKLMEDVYFCPPRAAYVPASQAAAQQMLPGSISWDSTVNAWRCSYTDPITGDIETDAELMSSTLINKHAFLVWYLKIYQVKLTNVDGERDEHNAGDWTFGEEEDSVEDTLNVSQDTLLRVTVKGWFFSGNRSGRGAVCVDIDGDGNELEGEEASEPGEPYQLPMYETGCPDGDDEIVDHGHWVLPDDLPALAGPEPLYTRPNWDVMSEADASSTAAVGPKSTLDSHDDVARPWIPCLPGVCPRKTVVPDDDITEADAIMPPLKIRAGITGEPGDVGSSGFLKEAMKDVVYGSTNDYHSIMIPAEPWIPPFVNNGGYDWDSWFCRVQDGNVMSPEDGDNDGVTDADDNCRVKPNPNQYDLDVDCPARPFATDPKCGDACDGDIDGDGDANADDPCDYDDTVTVAVPGTDTDGDGTPDSCDLDPDDDTVDDEDADLDGVKDTADNCPNDANADQTDTDKDKAGDVCDDTIYSGGPFTRLVAPIFSCPAGLGGLALGPYEFWTIINKMEWEDEDEADPALSKRPWYIEFYTDNRGEGMFFANGDFNLTYDDCRTDAISGAPDCNPGDAVGISEIKVVGDYPYFRKHSGVQSNLVEKTWEWDGYKRVTSERIDATHVAVIAHVEDRDGFCKYDVKSDPTAANGVTFSPSLHPVQGEEIEFILNTEVGSIIEVSPNGLYSAAHTPLGKASVTGLEDGVIINRSEAVALAEDARVLDYYDKARPVREEDECQAWVVIQHPLGEDPDVSVVFHDPEGTIYRHWPLSELLVSLVQGWNDVCYVDEPATVEVAMADFIDDVLAVYRYDAADTEDPWKRWIPELEDNDLLELGSYDQLFILMAASATWAQYITALPVSVDLAGASATEEVPGAWNSVCYAGADKAAGEAISDIESGVVIMYTLGSDQAWRRYVPGRPEIPDTLATLHRFDSVLLLVIAEGGTTWVFDP